MAESHLIDPPGRKINLHDPTWLGHVIKGHPEVKSSREEAEMAVRDPAQIHFSVSDKDCRPYYGKKQRSDRTIIVMVADVVSGFVKTAYPALRPKRGGVEWSALP